MFAFHESWKFLLLETVQSLSPACIEFASISQEHTAGRALYQLLQ